MAQANAHLRGCSVKLDMSTHEPFGLEAIETASRDEIAAR
jgi:hypothetical protein